MKELLVMPCALFLQLSFGQVAINSTNTLPHSSSMLDITSNSKGILIPRMTTVERNAIVSPAKGLMVFDNDTNSFWDYNGSIWDEVMNLSKNVWNKNGNNIYNTNSGNVGIGVNNPTTLLDLLSGDQPAEIKLTSYSGGSQQFGSYINLRRSWNAPSPTGYTIMNDVIGKCMFSGYNSASFESGAEIRGVGDGWWNTTSFPTRIEFHTVPEGTTSLTEKLRISHDGKIVVDPGSLNSGNISNALVFGGMSTGEGILSKRTLTGNQYGLDFYTNSLNRLSITNGGKVGIGTNNPQQALEVNGRIRQTVYSQGISVPANSNNNFVWTHNLGYQPIIMLTLDQTGGGYCDYVSYSYAHQSNNQLVINLTNRNPSNTANGTIRWIVVY